MGRFLVFFRVDYSCSVCPGLCFHFCIVIGVQTGVYFRTDGPEFGRGEAGVRAVGVIDQIDHDLDHLDHLNHDLHHLDHLNRDLDRDLHYLKQ